MQVARVESVLFSISLPACGSIYFKSDLEKNTKTVDVTAGDTAGKDASQSAEQMCIGPDVAQKWWFEKRPSLKVPRGPCKWREAIIMATKSSNADSANSLTSRSSIYRRRS